MALVISKETAALALVELGHPLRTWDWSQCLWQMGQALTFGSTVRAATALFSPCHLRSHRLRRAHEPAVGAVVCGATKRLDRMV